MLIAPRDVRDYIVSGRREGEQPPRLEIKQDRPPRQRLFWSGTLYHGVDQSEVRLHNISANGAMLDCGEDLMVGTVVVLELAGRRGERPSGAGALVPLRPARHCLRCPVRHADPRRGQALRQGREHRPRYVKPDYLTSEGNPESPWASRTDRLTLDDL